MAANKREKSAKYPGVYWRQNQSGEKTYYIRYRVGGREGKQIEEPVGKSSAGMTEARAAQARAARINGKDVSNKTQRENIQAQKSEEFRLREAWSAYSEINSDRPLYETDKCLLKYFPHLLDRSIKDITTSDIDAIRKKLEKTPSPYKKNGRVVMLAPASIVHVLSLIRRLVNFAVKRGLSPQPENLHFEMPRVDNQKTEVLTDEQLQRFLQALDEEPNQDAAALIRLALVTGMRKGALLGLMWDDCDFEHSQIRLRGESAKKGRTEFIPMNQAARAVLESIQDRSSDFVFPGKDGGQRKEFRRMANRVKRKAGLPDDFRPLHGLRHNYASRLASSGKVELYTLQRLLTHSSPQMTQRYAHLRDETLMKAAKLADEMLLSDNGQTIKND